MDVITYPCWDQSSSMLVKAAPVVVFCVLLWFDASHFTSILQGNFNDTSIAITDRQGTSEEKHRMNLLITEEN